MKIVFADRRTYDRARANVGYVVNSLPEAGDPNKEGQIVLEVDDMPYSQAQAMRIDLEGWATVQFDEEAARKLDEERHTEQQAERDNFGSNVAAGGQAFSNSPATQKVTGESQPAGDLDKPKTATPAQPQKK